MEFKEKDESVASRLRLAREMSGLSKIQVAALLGIPEAQISDAENGTRILNTDEILQFANYYDVNKDWLKGTVAEKIGIDDETLQLAARDLQKLEPDDLERILTLIAARRGSGELHDK
jgi:transcriptional regulator with XRE-family HTH domain